MGVIVYTGEKRDWGQSEWMPDELSEVASLLAFAFSATKLANVLVLTGVEHKLFAERGFDYNLFIQVEKAIGDWRSAIKYVQNFCLDIRHRISGKRISRRPYPVIIMNDVDYWVSGGISGLFAETCDPMLIQRVNELGEIIEPFNGYLVVLAAVTKLNERFSEVIKQQNWIWRQRNDMASHLTGLQIPSQQEPLKRSAVIIKTKSSSSASERHKIPSWCNAPDKAPPIEFQFGPLTGTQKELASWLYADGKYDRRRLQTKAENGLVWVRPIDRYHYEIFFKHQKDHEVATERRLKSQKQNQS